MSKTNYRIRKSLHVPLINEYTNNLTFIMMNPASADRNNSDDTVNRCLKIGFNFPEKYQIGTVSVINMQPIYESNSEKLQEVISCIPHRKYIDELTDNMKTIKKTIQKTDFIFLATGENPKGIDKKLYRGLYEMVLEFIESYKGCAFLGKKIKSKSFLTNSGYSRHIHPKRQGYLEVANLHMIRKLKLFADPKGDFRI